MTVEGGEVLFKALISDAGEPSELTLKRQGGTQQSGAKCSPSVLDSEMHEKA